MKTTCELMRIYSNQNSLRNTSIFFSIAPFLKYTRCVESARIRSYSGPHFSRIRTEYVEKWSISLYSVRMRENAGKYGPEKLRIRTLFTHWYLSVFSPNAVNSGKMLIRKTPNTGNFYAKVISPYSLRIRENAGKMRTRITPNTDTFYAVKLSFIYLFIYLLIYLFIYLFTYSFIYLFIY